MYLPLSKHFPAAWSLPQNTAYFFFFPDFLHLFSDSDHSYSDLHKNKRNKQCFDSTLGKRAYKAFEWEAKFVWVMRGVLSEFLESVRIAI